MLLEYFLSTTHPDTMVDVSKSSNNASRTANIFPDGNSEQFKNALNNSIESRQKYHVKQDDAPFSESELLHTVQEWDKLYSEIGRASNAESLDIINQFFDSEEASSLAIIAKNQRFHTDYNVGDMVPIDGKKLPDNLEIQANAQTNSSEKSLNANLQIKVSDLVSTNASKGDTSKNGPVVQQINSQSEGQLKDQGLNTKAIKAATIDAQSIQNKDVAQPQLTEKKTIESKLEGLLIKDKALLAEGEIRKQPLDTIKASEISTTKSLKTESPAQVATAIPKSVNSQQTAINQAGTIQPEIKQVKIDEKSITTNKAEHISNLLAGTEKDKSAAATTSSNNSVKALTGLLDGSDKLSNIIANKEQSNSSIKVDNTILKSANIPVEVTKSKQSEVSGSNELLKSELDKRFSDQSPLLQPRQGTDSLLQTARRDDATASLLQSAAASISAQDSTSSGVKTLPVTVLEASSVQNQQNTIQNTNKAADAPLSAGVSANKWNQKFAEHVSMLALRGTTNAHIRLDPPELGPMAIRINHTGTETHVQFMVNNAVAKELVDSGMQRLREMLEQHGFDNVSVDVNEFSKEQDNLSNDEEFAQEIDGKIDEIQTNPDSISEKVKSNSLIDLFA